MQDPQDLYHTNGAGELVLGHPNQVRYHQDWSHGDSGGLVYSCPGGGNGQECSGTEAASIFAVHSGWLVSPEKHVGANIPNAHRDAILTFLTD